MFFFSIASNQFETNLTFLGQIPSLIQVLVTTESPRTWKWAPRKILGLFPKTCFRWNGPLHESLKNISYFGLQFSRDWSGVDSVIESMRKFFLTFSNHIQNVLCCCFCDTLQSSSDTVKKTFEQKRAPEGCSFCECVKRSPAPPPAEPSPQKSRIQRGHKKL